MQGLRLQFGRILAIALLPLLVFSVWQVWYNFKVDNEARQRFAADVAQSAFGNTLGTLGATKSVISIGGQRLAPETCGSVIGTMVSVVPQLMNVVLTDTNGTVLCAGDDFDRSDYVVDTLPAITEANPYLVEALDDGSGQIVLTHAVYEDGDLKRSILAIFEGKDIAALVDRSGLEEGMELSIYNQYGDIVTGTGDITSRETLVEWFGLSEKFGRFDTRVAQEGGKRLLVIPAGDLGLYITLASPRPVLLSWDRVNTILTPLIPILSWIFAFAAIWWSTSRLLLNPIRSMRRQLLEARNGNILTPITFSHPPPPDIQDLGDTFNSLNAVVHKQKIDLKSSLEEKESLLREIHHRVKNNLQVIISLLNMQERKIDDRVGLSVVRESRYRVQAIALVHKSLYEGDSLRFINMDVFLRQMTTQLARALMLDRTGIKLIVESDCPPIESEKAMPITLFIVEAVTNAVKHGVPDGGEIIIALVRQDDNLLITVADNGGSKPVSKADGTGKRLMAGFARQLGGSYEAGATESGYMASLTCPFPEHTGD